MHQKYTFRNKRIDSWLLKLQDLVPQILAIKYRKGIDNVGPDFLTRYEPLDSSYHSSDLPNTSFDSPIPLPQRVFSILSNSSDIDWPPGTVTWASIVLSPIVTRSKARATSHPSSLNSAPAASIVDDDEDEYCDALPDSISHPNCSSPSASFPLDSSPLDLSLSRIKLEQHSDPEILSLIERLRRNPSDTHFVLEDDMVFRFVSVLDTAHSFHIPYLPKSLIPLVLHFYHDQPLSRYFGVYRTLSRIRDRFWWPNMHASVQNYVTSCSQCARHNILRTKTHGHLKSIEPPSAVFQVLHMDF
jgi:Integrase zinc binding domain